MSTRKKYESRGVGGSYASGGSPPSGPLLSAVNINQSFHTHTTSSGTIHDVKHIVILMQENRSFDHYFGTLRGVRGFGDRHPVPLPDGRSVWHQSDGEKITTPYHLNTRTTSAQRVPSTPHDFSNSQAAWNQGKFGLWPRFKTPFAMGHYRREDIPFQFALADAFTVCDAYHCSITSGTDPNRIVFWSGSNADPRLRERGEHATDADSEPNNLRCWIKGQWPDPGYTYAGTPFTWPTIPELLGEAGVTWRIYQDPNDNWTGAMHGCLAFESFRTASRDSRLAWDGMTYWSLDDLTTHVMNGTLPQVSWILPPSSSSEHPMTSSPIQGAAFTARVLGALTANPDVWRGTALFLTFDENDGFFDHVPPPAPPSYDLDGRLAGRSTVDLSGEYFHDVTRKYLDPQDTISGNLRPWGLGPRVPMYVISPWSRGGWVNSEIFDHTSVGRFLEKRFGITVPSISPWRRAVCGDLTSAFDFSAPIDPSFPSLPNVSAAATVAQESLRFPMPAPPENPQPLFQEKGVRRSRALPYELHVDARRAGAGMLVLTFRNAGRSAAVFHVYDRLHLERIPRRYTVEPGKKLRHAWDTFMMDDGYYDLWVYGPGGFIREFRGHLTRVTERATAQHADPRVEIRYELATPAVRMTVINTSRLQCELTVNANAYRTDGPWTITVAPGKRVARHWVVASTWNWYDFTVTGIEFERRFAGRLETGTHGVSDPAMAENP